MRMRFFLTACGMVCLGLLFGPSALAQQAAPAQDGVQDLIYILEYAHQHNPTLEARRANLRAVEEELSLAQAGWKPFVSAELALLRNRVDTRTGGSGFAENDTQFSNSGDDAVFTKSGNVSVSQPLFRGGRTLADVKAAKSTIRAAMEGLSALENDILSETATAYMDVVRDEALIDVRENNRNVLLQQEEAAQAGFEVGELTITDVSLAKSRRAEAEADLIATYGELQRSVARLKALAGLTPTILIAPDFALDLPRSLEAAQTRAKTGNPDLLAAQAIYEASESDVDGSFGALLPELNAVGRWGRSEDPSDGIDRSTDSSIGVVATIPLYQSGAERARLRQSKHIANRDYIAIRETEQAVQQQVTSAWEDLQAAEAQIGARKAQIEAALVAQEGIGIERDYGTRSVLDALDADQEVLNAQVGLVTAERDRLVAMFALASEIGLLTPEYLSRIIVRDPHKVGDEITETFDSPVGTGQN